MSEFDETPVRNMPFVKRVVQNAKLKRRSARIPI